MASYTRKTLVTLFAGAALATGIASPAGAATEVQDGLVPVILVTHRVVEQRIDDAIAALERLDDVVDKVVRIRVEQLN